MPKVTPQESPPVEISKGLSTYAGLAGAVVAALPLVVDAITDERIDPLTRKWLIICGTALLIAVILIRGAQAVAAEIARSRRV